MLKKIFFIFIGLVSLLIVAYNISQSTNEKNAFIEILGQDNMRYVNLIEELHKNDFAGDGFLDIYVFKIKNQNKFSCNNFYHYKNMKKFNIDKIESKYLKPHKKYSCQKEKTVKNTTISILVQDDILIIRKIGSSMPNKSYAEFKKFLKSKSKGAGKGMQW